MRLFAVGSFVLCLACAGASPTSSDDDSGGGRNDDTGATDTGNGDSGGTDTGRDTGSGGNDTGRDTGSGGNDTASGGSDSDVATDPDAGDYRGTIVGRFYFGGVRPDCEGETTFTVADGVLSGDAACAIREWGTEFAGPLEATVSGGRVEGTWTIDVASGYPVPVTVSGTRLGGLIELDLAANFDWGTFEGQIDASR